MIIPREPLTKENIFKKITSFDIFKYYCSGFSKVGEMFKSELRDDSNPSCCISYIRGDLLYTDFGEGSYRALDYVMRKYNLNYSETLHRINIDFNLGLGSPVPYSLGGVRSTPLTYGKMDFKEKKPTILRKKQRPFTKKDLEYWNSFYWTEWMLNEAKTQSISHYWINDNMWAVKNDELAFSYEYYWHDERMQRKLYFPEKEDFTWLSNVDNTIVQLVDVMPNKGDVLFITSSKKDAGIFWRMQLENMFPGLIIHGVAPNNEGAFVPENWFYKIKERWDKVIIWYNNDIAGIRNASKYSNLYSIPYFYNPLNSPKDPSDFSKNCSIFEFKKLIEYII